MKLYIFWRKLHEAENEFDVVILATMVVKWLDKCGVDVFNSAFYIAILTLALDNKHPTFLMMSEFDFWEEHTSQDES